MLVFDPPPRGELLDNAIARRLDMPYREGMKVHFKPELQARLTQRANQQGRDPDEFVQDVIARYLEEEDRFIEAVERGDDALKNGHHLTHEQVGERLHRFLQS
jgi:predicted transcriptional regulator